MAVFVYVVVLGLLGPSCAEAKASYDDGIVIERDDIGFVTREGRHLRDARGNPFFIVGTNSYYLLEHASETEPWLKRSIVTDTLDEAKKMGLNTVRTWAFYDGKLQTAPGEYDEEWLDALDFVVAAAGERGLKLVLSLTNFWDAYGGMESYVMWANDANETAGLSVSEFYTSEATREMYKQNFRFLKGRTNKYTNLTYAEDPTIMAWELANEPRNPGDYTGEVLREWIAEMSHFVKSEAPNQLVTSGSEGFFGPSTMQYMHLNGNGTFDHGRYLAQMCTGVDFLAQHDNRTAIDLPSFHLYPDHHAEELCGRGAPASDCALQWARAHTKARLKIAAESLGKPLYLGEFGKMKHPTMEGTLDAQVVYRNRLFAQVYDQFQRSAVDAFDEDTHMFGKHTGVGGGTTFWMLSNKEYKDYDNFTVYAYTNGPSLPPPWVPEPTAVEAQSDFRNIDEELECVENALRVHPDWIRHSWFVRGGDADLWPDTVPRLEKENENIRTRTYTHGHHPGYVFDFDPEVAHDWTLDASTVELISNHAKNMEDLARLNRHDWWG